MTEIYFDDVIMVDRIDPDGKQYDKGVNFAVEMTEIYFDDVIMVDRIDPDVSRIEARSEEYNMEMQVDLNTEIYPVRVGERLRMAITPNLYLDGKAVASDEGCVRLFRWSATDVERGASSCGLT